MIEILDNIKNNLDILYKEISKDKMNEIIDILDNIQKSQDELDIYISLCKSNIYLNFEEAYKIVANYLKNLKSSTIILYKSIEAINDEFPSNEDILELLSNYLGKINEQIKDWKNKQN